MKSEHLKEIFGHYGNVVEVKLHLDRRNMLSKGSADIFFATERDAEHACYFMDGGQIDGNEVKVSFILVRKTSRENSPSAGKYTPLSLMTVSMFDVSVVFQTRNQVVMPHPLLLPVAVELFKPLNVVNVEKEHLVANTRFIKLVEELVKEKISVKEKGMVDLKVQEMDKMIVEDQKVVTFREDEDVLLQEIAGMQCAMLVINLTDSSLFTDNQVVHLEILQRHQHVMCQRIEEISMQIKIKMVKIRM